MVDQIIVEKNVMSGLKKIIGLLLFTNRMVG